MPTSLPRCTLLKRQSPRNKRKRTQAGVNVIEPADAMGVRFSQVKRHFTVGKPAAWPQSPPPIKLYAAPAKNLQPDAASQAALIATSEGWMHKRLFKASSQ